MDDLPTMPDATPGDASGLTVAIALIALAQYGDLSNVAEAAAVIAAALVAAVTVYAHSRLRMARNGTVQVGLEVEGNKVLAAMDTAEE